MDVVYSEKMAIGLRLRQLLSQIDMDAERVYAEQGIQFEQRWYEVMKQLKLNGVMTIKAMVEALGTTRAYLSEIRISLEAAGLIRTSAVESDRLERRMSLTQDGKNVIKKLSPIWQALDGVSTELNFASGNVVAALDKLDETLQSRSLLQRTRDHLKYTSVNDMRKVY